MSRAVVEDIAAAYGCKIHQIAPKLAPSASRAGEGGAGSVQAEAYPSESDMTAQAASGGVREPTATFTTEDPAAGGDAMRFGPDAEVAMIQRIHDLERLCGSQALELQQLRHALERERRRGYNQPDDRPDEKGGRR
ncbi:MAG TPA: hypothetical protein VMW52_02035 [Phycisphaerae bacterium]|nr:hypothetical protein [Phycisphaerae bacterium]